MAIEAEALRARLEAAVTEIHGHITTPEGMAAWNRLNDADFALRSARAEDTARAAEDKAELEGWKRVAVIAAVALEPLRMSGATEHMTSQTKEAVDLAVVVLRQAVAADILPPAGASYAEITAPAKALLEAADANR